MLTKYCHVSLTIQLNSHFVCTQLNYQTVLFQTLQFTSSRVFLFTQLNVKSVPFLTIPFSLSTQFSSIWPKDRTLSGTTTLGHCGPGSNGNQRVLCIPQSSSITGASPSDCLESYPGYLLEESYPSVKMQSLYSTTLADWTEKSTRFRLTTDNQKRKKSSLKFEDFCCCKQIIFTNPSARAGYDTRSIFKRSLTGLNSEFSFF